MRQGFLWGVLGTLSILAVASSPALASDSYSWGAYGADYGRARLSDIPQSVVATDGLFGPPWVVADPNQSDESQSTPVIVGDHIYFFAFRSSTHGALYQSDLTGVGPGPAREIVSFSASPYEQYDSPGDPSVSPDGRWLAYAAGKHLYWWRVGVWGYISQRVIPNATKGAAAYVSSAPLFVPDSSAGSGGWDVCSGSGNGGFACFTVSGPAGIGGIQSMQPYTTHGSPITSSAVEVSGTRVCFGVAAPAPRARVVCLNPHGSSVHDGMGAGKIAAPVDTALTYAGTSSNGASLYFTDQLGDAYRMDPRSGAILAETSATSDGGTSIAPVAVDGQTDTAYVVARSYTAICALDATTLRFFAGSFGSSCMTNTSPAAGGGTLGDMTAATVVPEATALCRGDMVWDATDGGVIGASGICPGQRSPVMQFAAPDGGGAGHNFSAAVVGVGPGEAYVVLWSDTAVTCWAGGACARRGPGARFVGPHGRTGGGLEIWRLRPPLTAWFESNPAPANVSTASPGGGLPTPGECLLALATPGEFTSLVAVLPGGGRVDLNTAPEAVGAVTLRTGPLFEPGVPRGCPPPKTTSDGWEDLKAQWNASGPSGDYPGMVDRRGTPPGRFGTYQLWWGQDVPVPSRSGRWQATVSGTTATGARLSVSPTLYVTCPAADRVGSGGHCLPPVTGPPGGTAPPPNRPPCGWQAACPPEPAARGPWLPVLVCGGPIACTKDFPHTRAPGQFIPEPCDPYAPAGDPDRCAGPTINP